MNSAASSLPSPSSTVRSAKFTGTDLVICMGLGLVMTGALFSWWGLVTCPEVSEDPATCAEEVAARFVAISRAAEFSGETLVVTDDLDRTLEQIAETALSGDRLQEGPALTGVLDEQDRTSLKQWLHLEEGVRLEFLGESAAASSWPALSPRFSSPPIP